jgi:hypothetical protein
MFELDDQRRDELVELWAKRIVDRGLTSATVFLLEAHKPLSGIGAQVVLGFRPVFEILFRTNAAELAAFMRSPQNIEQLVRRIEELDRERRRRRTD